MLDDPRFVPFRGTIPTVAPDVFVADTARVIGDVHLGSQSSVWYGTVVRGDVFPIRVGARVNLQDLTLVHVSGGTYATTIGDDVTIGHRVVLHGCTVGAGALIGMGAIVMDGAVIGAGSLVGAGALVTPGTHIPPGMLALGTPARPKRPLTDGEREMLRVRPHHYAELASFYGTGGAGP